MRTYSEGAWKNTTLLQRVGEALYGPQWQSALARDLDVADRTMRRWVAGDMPDGVRSDLEALCRKRAADLNKLADTLAS